MVEMVTCLLFGFIGAFVGIMCGLYITVRFIQEAKKETTQQQEQIVPEPQNPANEKYNDDSDRNHLLNSEIVRRWWLGASSIKRRGEE